MEFKPFHKDFFKAINGAYSIVTERENYDSQITLTDIEAEIVINYFGVQNIHVGRVDRIKSLKNFISYQTSSQIQLNLVFPKPKKTELRLYLAKKAGYMPKGGEIWFIYENLTHQLVVGYMEERTWNSLGQTDSLDEEYQNKIETILSSKIKKTVNPDGRILISTLGSRKVYQRDPLIAIMRFNATGYSCEIDPSHTTFISQSSGLPYMEAHHFIPIKFQPLFKTPLDNFINLISLCPTCHRGIHHAIIDHKFDYVKNLYQKRPELSNYTLEYIAQFYNCLKINP